MSILDAQTVKLIRVSAEADLSGLVVSDATLVFCIAEGTFYYMNGTTAIQVSTGASAPGTTPSANEADAVAITGGEAPSEAEYNLLVTKINAILDILEEQNLMAAA